jgi:hypothetical protein
MEPYTSPRQNDRFQCGAFLVPLLSDLLLLGVRRFFSGRGYASDVLKEVMSGRSREEDRRTDLQLLETR